MRAADILVRILAGALERDMLRVMEYFGLRWIPGAYTRACVCAHTLVEHGPKTVFRRSSKTVDLIIVFFIYQEVQTLQETQT